MYTSVISAQISLSQPAAPLKLTQTSYKTNAAAAYTPQGLHIAELVKTN